MAKDYPIRTLQILGSQVVARPDGRAAIALTTPQGTIALELDLRTIDLLRADLARVEAVLRKTPGHA